MSGKNQEITWILQTIKHTRENFALDNKFCKFHAVFSNLSKAR
jgi:hypothetical protein